MIENPIATIHVNGMMIDIFPSINPNSVEMTLRIGNMDSAPTNCIKAQYDYSKQGWEFKSKDMMLNKKKP